MPTTCDKEEEEQEEEQEEPQPHQQQQQHDQEGYDALLRLQRHQCQPASSLIRSMDIIMYVLYSGDQIFVQDMVRKVLLEVADEQRCDELRALAERDSPQMYRCLFFLLLDFHARFRYWVLDERQGTGLQPVCPFKAVRFLKHLRAHIIPRFLVNETVRLDELEREIKVEYVRS